MAARNIVIAQATDADVLIKVGECVYYGFSLLGAAAGTIKVHDAVSVATAADTNLIDVGAVSAASTADHSAPEGGIKVTSGLVVVVTGAANLATVWYK